MVLISLLRKSFKRVQCSDEFKFNSHMRCYVTQWSMTMWWPQQFVQTPSPKKKTSAYQINLEVTAVCENNHKYHYHPIPRLS